MQNKLTYKQKRNQYSIYKMWDLIQLQIFHILKRSSWILVIICYQTINTENKECIICQLYFKKKKKNNKYWKPAKLTLCLMMTYICSKYAEITSLSAYCVHQPSTKSFENVRLVLMNALKGENITSHLGKQHGLVQILSS